MGAKTNFAFSIIALVIAIAGCVLAVKLFFFRPAPVTEEKVSAIIEEKTKTYITEKEVKKMVEEAVAGLKPAAEKGEE